MLTIEGLFKENNITDNIIHFISSENEWYCVETNEDYDNNLNDCIEEYIFKYQEQSKVIVDRFGIFNAVKLYYDSSDEFVLNDDEIKNYTTLAIMLIKEWFKNNYSFDKLAYERGDYELIT